MWKFLANLLLAGLAIGLTFFTATRTLDLLAQWLPANQEIMQWLGLAAFEGGLYFWSFYFVTAAKGIYQRGIAGLMIVVCFCAVAVATVSDLLLVGAESGKLPAIPSSQKQAIVVFVGVVIVLNVAAFLSAKLTHPDKLKEMAIQDAEDQIHDMELKLIRKVAPSVATQMAPIKAEQWVTDAWTRMLPGAARPMEIEGSVQYQPESAPLYREEQRTRRANPSAGLPLIPDEETALSRPAPAPQQKKRGWLPTNPFAAKTPPAPAPSVHDIAAAMLDMMQKQQSAAQPAPVADAAPVTPPKAAPEPVQPSEPITETLAPFTVAPSQSGNGATNGHHPKPMPQ